MAKILHGIVDDGTREIPLINKYGKTICTVYMRPADFSIVDRYNALMQNFNDVVKPLTELSIRNDGTAEFEQDWQVLKAVEANLKQKINELFDFDEADAIFAKRNPFSSVGGEFFCLKVLTALGGVITEAIEEEAELSRKRMDKYLHDIEIKSDKAAENAGAVTDNA